MATVRNYEHAVNHKLGCTVGGKKHQKWSFTINGKLIGWSMVSHGLRGSDQLSDRTLGDMAREMRCSPKTWKRIVDCPGSKQDYLDELFSAGLITSDEYQAALR